jgi:hypothetical protein
MAKARKNKVDRGMLAQVERINKLLLLAKIEAEALANNLDAQARIRDGLVGGTYQKAADAQATMAAVQAVWQLRKVADSVNVLAGICENFNGLVWEK